MKSSELRKQVNEKLIEALSKHVFPWRRPWSSSKLTSGRHRNLVSQRPYSGVNPLLLELHSLKHGFASNLWLTFNQAKGIGCTVKKRPGHVPPGQWGCTVVFCRPISKPVVDQGSGEEKEEKFLILRSFTVFNVEQLSGEAVDQLLGEEKRDVASGPDYPTAQALLDATGAKITHQGDRAYYARPLPEGTWPNHQGGDYIVLPERHRFESPETYYETAFHELAHFSEVRLGWDHRKHGYAMGELVAEITSTYLASELGIALSLENHAAYLKSWLQGMKQSPSFIFQACSAASRTSDYLLSFIRADEDGSQEEAGDEKLALTPA